jgi:hypothetical protein
MPLLWALPLFITTVEITKRPINAGRAVFQMISMYMACPPGLGGFLVRHRHHDPGTEALRVTCVTAKLRLSQRRERGPWPIAFAGT